MAKYRERPEPNEGGCAHCWHDRGQWSDSTGTHRSEKCCHCGEFRQVRVAPSSPFISDSWTTPKQPKHGPHATAPDRIF